MEEYYKLEWSIYVQSDPRIVNLLVISVNTSKCTSNISKSTSTTDQKEPQVGAGLGSVRS